MSEWVNCPRCGTLMENLCACPNMHCADYAATKPPSLVLSLDILIERLRSKGWWNGDQYATALLKPLLDELATQKGEAENLARWKREALTVEAWWKRVDDFVRAHPNAPLGAYVSATALEWLRQRDAMLLAFAQIKEALAQIPPHLAVGSDARATINTITALCSDFLTSKPIPIPSPPP